MRSFASRLVLVAAVLAVAAGGCASFAGRQLPERGFEGLSPRGLAVDYSADWLTVGTPNSNASNALSYSVRRILDESKMFARVTQGDPDVPLRLRFLMKNEGSPGAAAFLGAISGFTLTIIPAYARDDYILSVDVERSGESLKTYEYRDYVSTWIQLFMLAAMSGRDGQAVGDQVRSNMIRTFLHEFESDMAAGEIVVDTERAQQPLISQRTAGDR